MAEDPSAIGQSHHLFRVRIRSREILRHLFDLFGWQPDHPSITTVELVFCRPFSAFAFYHEAMKERLRKMESDQNQSSPNEPTKHEDESTDSVAALEELRCYVTFIEQTILPLRAQYFKVDKSTPKKVFHEEIPLLFRPGELVFVPSSSKISKAYRQSAIQNVWRMYSCDPLDVNCEHDGEKWLDPDNITSVYLYCLDHDGDELRTSWRNVGLKYFPGEREITSLECFPLKFHPRRDQIFNEQIERGKAFYKLVQADVNHFYYSGWNLITGIYETDESEIIEPEHVESEVIIDIREADRHMPEWTERDVPEIASTYTFQADPSIITYRIWDLQAMDQEKTDIDPYVAERVYELLREDFIYSEEAREFNRKMPYIEKDGRLSKALTDEDYALLPRRISGYVLRERKFARLDVQSFQYKAGSERITLNDIQTKEEYRKVIRSSVSTHFLRATQSKTDDFQMHNPDIIRGKGRGLVILLHGAPGVGKTATAEAVAQEFRKPLFPITCGDLGVTPDTVEKTLKDIFRYAHLWDCILLLDEADVFLTQRDRTNVKRNALVSVFLRVLEYYSGILFLTTNRVGALDEAFRSRVHISLYYPHLSYDDTIEILRQNLNRLPRAEAQPENVTITNAHIQAMEDEIIDFMKQEYKKYSQIHRHGPWNGRQIRNAVQIAACIALFDKKDGPKNLPSVLTAQHFRTVHQTMTEFDQYMTKTQIVDDSAMARMAGDRVDDYEADDAANNHEPVAYQGFAGFGTDHQQKSPQPGRSAGRGIASSAAISRGGPSVQGQGFHQSVRSSRGNYSVPTHAAGQGQAPYRTSPAYNQPPMEEGDNPFSQRASIGERIRAADTQSQNRRASPSAFHGGTLMQTFPEEHFPDDLEYSEEQTHEYELHSSGDYRFQVDTTTATLNNYQALPRHDPALVPATNPSSISGARVSTSQQAGFQRQI
ncbi:hypothetical protein N7490_003282 [Penicillium lividum]|nr:hypothetical protein N7490_003282 [Penicillium lividum]